jgi:hypothetical protein
MPLAGTGQNRKPSEMLNSLLNMPLPIFDAIFANWEIPTSFSKLVVLFSLITAILISRLSVSSPVIVVPSSFLFLLFCAIGTHWIMQDINLLGVDPFRKILTALVIGQSLGGLIMMAFFKTGNRRIAGV